MTNLSADPINAMERITKVTLSRGVPTKSRTFIPVNHVARNDGWQDVMNEAAVLMLEEHGQVDISHHMPSSIYHVAIDYANDRAGMTEIPRRRLGTTRVMDVDVAATMLETSGGIDDAEAKLTVEGLKKYCKGTTEREVIRLIVEGESLTSAQWKVIYRMRERWEQEGIDVKSMLLNYSNVQYEQAELRNEQMQLERDLYTEAELAFLMAPIHYNTPKREVVAELPSILINPNSFPSDYRSHPNYVGGNHRSFRIGTNSKYPPLVGTRNGMSRFEVDGYAIDFTMPAPYKRRTVEALEPEDDFTLENAIERAHEAHTPVRLGRNTAVHIAEEQTPEYVDDDVVRHNILLHEDNEQHVNLTDSYTKPQQAKSPTKAQRMAAFWSELDTAEKNKSGLDQWARLHALATQLGLTYSLRRETREKMTEAYKELKGK